MVKAFKIPENFKLSALNTWFRTAKQVGNTTQLSRRHIYILPTRFSWLYAVLLVALLTGSINYSLSLGFAMTFLLTGLGLVSMLHSWRNLANLKISALRAQPVFAGEEAIFELSVLEESNRARYAIKATLTHHNNIFTHMHSDDIANGDLQDISALSHSVFKLALASQQRGWLKAPRITFSTEFPVSLFYVWAYAKIEAQCLIYPAPSLHSPINPSATVQGFGGKNQAQQGDDDFVGHRNYQFGDSPKRVDWKASSREQGLLTKLFQGEATSTLWLDFAATTGDNIELRISQLTRWVLDAKNSGSKYGLRLPNLSITPNTGLAHFHQCLAALALM